ncbi:MAG TPA: hypothetical protein VMG82_06905 [Candidatus Sulfotelmatobacter sp.]|nr:hypothetical protein [Candidatus Sulfotelmatobacter sp.]
MKEGRLLRFKGTPFRLTALFEFQEASALSSVGRVTLTDSGPLPLMVRRLRTTTPALSTLSFRLPGSTPPGSYRGSAELAGEQIPIAVDVEPRSSVRFIPAEIAHRGKFVAGVSADVTLVNQGNVDVEIPADDTFCVFDHGGVAKAFYRGLAEEPAAGKKRIDHIMDELAKAHGGLVRVTVTSGAGRLRPEEARTIAIDLHFSRRLSAGRTYRGAWEIAEASLDVEIELTGKPASRKERHE